MPRTSTTEKEQTRTYVTLTSKRDAAGKRVSRCVTVYGATPEAVLKLIHNAVSYSGQADPWPIRHSTIDIRKSPMPFRGGVDGLKRDSRTRSCSRQGRQALSGGSRR